MSGKLKSSRSVLSSLKIQRNEAATVISHINDYTHNRGSPVLVTERECSLLGQPHAFVVDLGVEEGMMGQSPTKTCGCFQGSSKFPLRLFNPTSAVSTVV